MKYFILLTLSIVFLTGYLAMAYFLWEAGDHIAWKPFIAGCVMFGFYQVVKVLKIYTKIQFSNDLLVVKKLFGSKEYTLNQLSSWEEHTNVYRVRFRKMTLYFGSEKVLLYDHADRDKIENFYHYLRTHFGELDKSLV